MVSEAWYLNDFLHNIAYMGKLLKLAVKYLTVVKKRNDNRQLNRWNMALLKLG